MWNGSQGFTQTELPDELLQYNPAEMTVRILIHCLVNSFVFLSIVFCVRVVEYVVCDLAWSEWWFSVCTTWASSEMFYSRMVHFWLAIDLKHPSVEAVAQGSYLSPLMVLLAGGVEDSFITPSIHSSSLKCCDESPSVNSQREGC